MKLQPKGYDPRIENNTLAILERIGQVLVTVLVVISADLNLRDWSPWSMWLVLSGVLMALYEGFWIRYFCGERTMKKFYSSFCGVPLAGATLPVMAFFCLGFYAKSIWLLLSVLILGVGHIGIHFQHQKALHLSENKENNP